jgi:hypothetical protein
MTIPAVPYRVKTAALTVRTASTTLGVKGPMAGNMRRREIAPELDGASGRVGTAIVILQQVEPAVGRPGPARGTSDFAVRDPNWARIVSEHTQGANTAEAPHDEGDPAVDIDVRGRAEAERSAPRTDDPVVDRNGRAPNLPPRPTSTGDNVRRNVDHARRVARYRRRRST